MHAAECLQAIQLISRRVLGYHEVAFVREETIGARLAEALEEIGDINLDFGGNDQRHALYDIGKRRPGALLTRRPFSAGPVLPALRRHPRVR